MRLVASAFLLMVCTSCATIIGGGPDSVRLTSRPEGALVTVNGQTVGRTPMRVALSRSEAADITVSMNGYHDHAVEVGPVLNPWIVASVFLGGFGIIVDFITGNAFTWSERPIHVRLLPSSGPPPSGPARAKKRSGLNLRL